MLYNPQMDGLVERFNLTLKRMLCKFVEDTGRDSDRWLPFLMFAYREVPQASTGFIRAPVWLGGPGATGPVAKDLGGGALAPSSSDRSMVQFMLEMRKQLAKYREEEEVNLREAQQSQKVWYDRQARQREFQPGQEVLLLLPSSTCKLLAKWQGPYTVTQIMGPVTYEIHHPNKQKMKQTYHVNLLNELKEVPFQVPVVSLLVTEVDLEKEEASLENLTNSTAPTLDHLTLGQSTQLSQVFQSVSSPGKTTVVEHVIRIKEAQPIRSGPTECPNI